MTSAVEGQFVFNAALLADLAQDVVAMAVARHIKDMVVEPLIRVFLDDAFGNIQQADTAFGIGFLTSRDDPQVTVEHSLKVVRGQPFHVGISQPRERRKKHQSKGDGNKENQTERVVKQRFCGCLPLQPNSKERQDNASFPLPSHYLSCYQLKAKKQHS